MIKVLNIISDSNIGGAGRCLLNFLKYFDRKKFGVMVVMPRNSLLKPEVEKLNIRVIEVDGIADKSFDFKAIGKINGIIEKTNPDIIHTHGTVTGRICAKMCGKKVIYTRHSVFPVSERVKKGVGRFINKYANELLADDIIAVAEAAKENLTDGGIAPEKIRVILNGVEPVKKISEEEKAEIRAKYDIKDDDFVMGIMARLNKVKGHEYIIKTAKTLKDEGRKIKVIIAGVGDEEESLKKLTKELNLEDTVKFAGFVDDVSTILNVMDLQLNASYGTEATSLALLEGMSLGIPAVVSDYGGNPGVIFPGENGFLFKTRDSNDMADKIRMIMDDKELYASMREKAKKIFNEKFTAQIYAQNIEQVYEDVYNRG